MRTADRDRERLFDVADSLHHPEGVGVDHRDGVPAVVAHQHPAAVRADTDAADRTVTHRDLDDLRRGTDPENRDVRSAPDIPAGLPAVHTAHVGTAFAVIATTRADDRCRYGPYQTDISTDKVLLRLIQRESSR